MIEKIDSLQRVSCGFNYKILKGFFYFLLTQKFWETSFCLKRLSDENFDIFKKSYFARKFKWAYVGGETLGSFYSSRAPSNLKIDSFNLKPSSQCLANLTRLSRDYNTSARSWTQVAWSRTQRPHLHFYRKKIKEFSPIHNSFQKVV